MIMFQTRKFIGYLIYPVTWLPDKKVGKTLVGILHNDYSLHVVDFLFV